MPLLEDWGIPSRLASLQGYAGCLQGYVTDLARHWLDGLDDTQRAEVGIYACGPHPMLEAVVKLAREYGLPVQVSLEEFMACAVGGCAGCVVEVSTEQGPAMAMTITGTGFLDVDGATPEIEVAIPEGVITQIREGATVAVGALLLAHALYKAPLFFVAGNIDHGTGTRVIDRLGNLRHAMPWTAAAALLAQVSPASALDPATGHRAVPEIDRRHGVVGDDDEVRIGRGCGQRAEQGKNYDEHEGEDGHAAHGSTPSRA